MPTPYRGRAEIKCLSDQCKQDISRRNVGKSCFGCELSEATIIDLDEKPIGIIKKQSKTAEVSSGGEDQINKPEYKKSQQNKK